MNSLPPPEKKLTLLKKTPPHSTEKLIPVPRNCYKKKNPNTAFH